MKKLSPYARKATFWSKLRVEKKLTLEDVGELLGESGKKVGGYFTGFLMPDDNTVRALCELFDVDFNKGLLEFQHAHRDYVAEHNAPVKYSASPKRKWEIDSAEDILTVIYGVLTCKEFVAIYETIKGNADDTVNPKKILYNKVDYDTYEKITEILNNKK